MSIPKVVVLSCGLLLCLGLSQTSHAVADEEGANRLAQAKVIKGDLMGIDYGDYRQGKGRQGSPFACW